MQKRKKIGIIGTTGSIGTQAIELLMQNQDQFSIELITAHNNEKLLDQIQSDTGAKHSFLTTDPNYEAILKSYLETLDLDMVLHAATGVYGINSAYMIVDHGIDIALANKESLVTAGDIIIKRAKETGSNIVPVDSEHSAIFQSLIGHNTKDIESITLTASGGPFRTRPSDSMDYISKDEALKHPKWFMGDKVSIDSATMMNKGLELIEAKYLFNIDHTKLNVVIHPESIIHSLVNYNDGSTIAQLSYPDMKIPISYALAYPNRVKSAAKCLDLTEIGKMTFFKPDLTRFKALEIALGVLESNSNKRFIMLNSSNEAAVMAFMRGDIKFTDITKVVELALDKIDFEDSKTVYDAIDSSKKAYETADLIIKKFK